MVAKASLGQSSSAGSSSASAMLSSSAISSAAGRLIEQLDAERWSGSDLRLDHDHGRVGTLVLLEVVDVRVGVPLEWCLEVEVGIDVAPDAVATVGQHDRSLHHRFAIGGGEG
jgi:hypothetical protein